MLEFDDGSGSLAGHVVDGVLITEPVGALDSIVHVPSPVILVHVAQGGVDTTLSSDGMTSSREKLGDTGCVKASLGQAKGCSEASATGSHHKGIVLVVLSSGKRLIAQNGPAEATRKGGRARIDVR